MYYLENYELFPFVSGHISNDTEQDKDKMGNFHVFATALPTKATISNVSIAFCVLFRPRELLKKSSLQFAIYFKAVQRDGKL